MRPGGQTTYLGSQTGETAGTLLSLPIPTISADERFKLKNSNLKPELDKDGKFKKPDSVLSLIRELLSSQRTNSAQDISKLVLEMTNSSIAVNKRLDCQKLFKDQENKNDPENPTYIPRSMKVKTTLTFPKECEGDAIMLELQEKQAAVNKTFMFESGKLCSQAADRALEIFRKKRLDTFANCSIDLFETYTSYHSFLVHPETDDTRNKRLLATKILAALIKAPSNEGLDDDFLTKYLQTTRGDLVYIVIQQSTFNTTFAEEIESATFTQEEIDIAIPVLKEVLPFFTVITKDLQEHLDYCLLVKKAEAKSLAHSTKRDMDRKAAETAVDIDEEPATSQANLSQYLRTEAAKAVRIESKREANRKDKVRARKNDSGMPAAPKRARTTSPTGNASTTISGNAKDSNTIAQKGKSKKKNKQKPKSILKKPGKYQGGNNKGGVRKDKPKKTKK